jgi:hypothetical protein
MIGEKMPLKAKQKKVIGGHGSGDLNCAASDAPRSRPVRVRLGSRLYVILQEKKTTNPLLLARLCNVG